MLGYCDDSHLDRVEALRLDPALAPTLWTRADAVVLEVSPRGVLADSAGEPARRAPREPFDPERHLLLGLVTGVPYFAALVEDEAPVVEFRIAAMAWDDTLRDAVTTTLALSNWHRESRFCSKCGSLTEVALAGLVRHCASCGRDRFPRTDPAMIVAVRDADDRLLLGRQSVWAPGRFSLLAGFMSAGETLEACVRREVAEEAGIVVGEVTYLASQPWPFPRSLMLGASAVALTTSIQVDQRELEEARWVSREDLDQALATGELSLPANVSIAHRIIAAWRAGELPKP
ncbi:MAG: NAD(+) diphosphatase [Propionibacteriaceae bacterium]|nr:NAD(+) diphosphatase [Propionibacteriaceae bacterium]HBY23497.1 NAD(+) diphosphatase [Propionibacteriaceae bacterium]